MVHENSLTAYKGLVLPNLKRQHERVVEVLKTFPNGATSLEVADKLNKPLNAISGRFTELSGSKEYGRPIIEEAGRKLNRYGNMSTIWKVKQYQPVGTPQELFRA